MGNPVEKSPMRVGLESDAATFAARAEVVHDAVAKHFHNENRRLSAEIDGQSRRLASLKAEAVEAAKQADDSKSNIEAIESRIAETRADIATQERQGNQAAVAESLEDVRLWEGNLESEKARAARLAEVTTRLQADLQAAEATAVELDTEMKQVVERSRAAEAAADILDDKAALLSEAAEHAAEMERLTAEVNRLESEGKLAEAVRIQEAVDAHVAQGVEKLTKAYAMDVDEDVLDQVPGASATPMVIREEDIEMHSDEPTPTGAAPQPAPPPSSTDDLDLDADNPHEGQVLQSRATEVRAAFREHLAAEDERIMLLRDSAARKAWSSEQEAKAADQQVAREQKTIDQVRARITGREAELARLEADFDPSLQEVQEALDDDRRQLNTAMKRLDSASEESTRLRLDAAKSQAKVTELEAEKVALTSRSDRAEKALDAMEDKAVLLSEANFFAQRATERESEADDLSAAGKQQEAAELRRLAAEDRQLAGQRSTEAAGIVVSESAFDFLPLEPSTEPVAAPVSAVDVLDDPIDPTGQRLAAEPADAVASLDGVESTSADTDTDTDTDTAGEQTETPVDVVSAELFTAINPTEGLTSAADPLADDGLGDGLASSVDDAALDPVVEPTDSFTEEAVPLDDGFG